MKKLLKWVKRLLILGFAVLLISFIALEILLAISLKNGVEIVSIPEESKIASMSLNNDYSDSYRVQIKSVESIDQIIGSASNIGKEINRNSNEILFSGSAPGLEFLASYYLDRDNSQTYLHLNTVVFYKNTTGLIYFTPVKQFHKRGVPYFFLRQTSEWQLPTNDN